MNNNGIVLGSVSGVTSLTAGAGIVCTPNPIVRTGIVSISPIITATIAETATTVQNIESTETTTSVVGSFRVVDVNLDPSLVVHGSTVAVSNLQPCAHHLHSANGPEFFRHARVE